MKPINWKRKLSSRKLWAAVAGVVTGLAIVFGLDESVISSVAGAVVSVASVVTYIITEGKVDTESVKNAVDGIQDAVNSVQNTGVTVMKNKTIFDAEYKGDKLDGNSKANS